MKDEKDKANKTTEPKTKIEEIKKEGEELPVEDLEKVAGGRAYVVPATKDSHGRVD